MLRSSSAATNYVNCVNKTLGKSTVHCRYVGGGSDLKKHNLYYDLHWQKTDAKYKYLKVTLKNSTKTYDNGKTVIKATPMNWSVNCFNDKSVSTFETPLHSDGKPAVVKVPKKYVRCGINTTFNYYQYGPVDGYVFKSTSGISHSVYLK